MKANKHQNKNFHFLKIATKAFVLASVFSVILSYSSLLTFHVIQFFSYNIDKNYMFLLCNGILVFIAKYSGLVGNSQLETDSNGENYTIKNGDNQRQVTKLSESRASVAEESAAVEVEQAAEVESGSSKGGEDALLIAQDEDEEQENELLLIDDDDDDDDDDDGGSGFLSTEELNKKCEDFIRKMRKRIKFEAQQLIVV